MGKKKAKDVRAQEFSLVNSLQFPEIALQYQPSNNLFLEEVSKTINELRKLQSKKIQGARIKSRTNWMTLGG